MNIVDAILIFIIIYFLFVGYFQGFIRQFLDLLVLVVAFVFAFRFYSALGALIASMFSFASSFANVAGFFAIWCLVEFIYYIAFVFFYKKIPENIRESNLNVYGGVVPAFFRAIFTIWIFLSLILILPIPSDYRKMITSSTIGGPLVKSSPVVEKYVERIFGGAINDTLTFLTVKPEGEESVNLGYKTTSVSVDEAAENKMLELVNKERASRGLNPLVMDEKLREVARAHSKDMFAKGYFSHKNLEGQSPFDRMDKAGVQYMVAGENLALAPDVEIAHNGLMNSPGHKRNILTPEFRKIGIGVIDGGKYGEMFSQEFTD